MRVNGSTLDPFIHCPSWVLGPRCENLGHFFPRRICARIPALLLHGGIVHSVSIDHQPVWKLHRAPIPRTAATNYYQKCGIRVSVVRYRSRITLQDAKSRKQIHAGASSCIHWHRLVCSHNELALRGVVRKEERDGASSAALDRKNDTYC